MYIYFIKPYCKEHLLLVHLLATALGYVLMYLHDSYLYTYIYFHHVVIEQNK